VIFVDTDWITTDPLPVWTAHGSESGLTSFLLQDFE